MKNVRLNTKLIATLSNVLFVAPGELKQKASFTNATWYRVQNHPETITIQQLLTLANNLHIPVRRFFSFGSTDIIGTRDDYITEPYLPCHYDGAALRDIIDNRPGLTWKRAAEAVGKAYNNLQKSLSAERRSPVGEFLTVCATFDIDPFSVLIDPNPEPAKGRKPRSGDTELRRQVDSLNRRMNEVCASIDSLTEKYRALLEAHQRLLQRINVRIENFTDSNLNIAAEAPADLKKK